MPAWLVAEIGVNWNGDRKRIPRFIQAAAKAGVTHVKFQAFNANDLIQLRSITDKDTIGLLRRCELTDADLHLIQTCAADNCVGHFWSVFDPSQVKRVLRYKPNALKISHKEAGWDELVAACKADDHGLPVWISGDEKCSNVWGIWEYPAKSKPQLNRLRERGYHGFSSHFKDECVPALAAAFCDYVEAHFALSVNDPEWEWSLNLAQLESMVRQARMFESWL